jgi:DNA-binding PadR family transcriptional regulator
MFDLLLLSMLLEGPKHGYRLKREAGLMLGQGDLHNNLVYPLLRSFVKEGLVTQKAVAGERGQTRKLYVLTAAGRRVLLDRASQYDVQTGLEVEPFLLRVGLFGLLAPPVRERILKTREVALRAQDDRFAGLQQSLNLGLYGSDIVGHQRKMIAAELDWIRHLRQLQNQTGGNSE